MVRLRPKRTSSRQVWAIAWPLILAHVTVPLLGVVDTAVVGHLDSAVYLGAVSVGASIYGVVFWSFSFLRMGTTGFIAQAYGRRDHDELRDLIAQAVILAIGIGTLLILLQAPIIDTALRLMDASTSVRTEATKYCSVRMYSAPAVLTRYALLGFFVGIQNTRAPLVVVITSNVVNIALDVVFVMGLGMRSEGVALATAIADGVGVILSAYYAIQILRSMGISFSKARISRISAYLNFLSLNRYLFVRTLCLLFTFSFFTAKSAQQGDDILSANSVLLNLLMVLSFALDGFAHAAEALVGKAVGQQSLKKFRVYCVETLRWTLGSTVVLTLLLWLLGPMLIDGLTGISEVRIIAKDYLLWLVSIPMIACISYWLDGVFVGMARARSMQNSMLAATLLVYLPTWYFAQPLGNRSLWLAMLLFFVARSIGLGFAFLKLWRNPTLAAYQTHA